jgi:endonuclease/exonuclease/phosphatase family metal-dependent hydrolase
MARLKLLTLNIWNKQGPWADRAKLIRAGLESLSPDLIGLQEVLHHDAESPDQAQELAAGLGYHVAFASAWHIGGGLQFGNAVLSRWPITAAENFPLPNEASEESRALLYVRAESPYGSIPLFCTHLNWKFHHGYVRERQAQFIADKVHDLAPTGDFPPILMGDFNAEPDADEIRFLRGLCTLRGRSTYFADCFALAGEGPGHTYARSNVYAEKLREPNRRIDYIFVRGPDRKLRGEPLAARVVFDHPEAGVFPTDHYGVYAEIEALGNTVPTEKTR